MKASDLGEFGLIARLTETLGSQARAGRLAGGTAIPALIELAGVLGLTLGREG